MENSKNILLLVIVFLLTANNHVAALTFWPDTGQEKCYDNNGPIPCPQEGQPFYGQDAQYRGQKPSYTKLDAKGNALPGSAESWTTVYDNVTALTWEVKTDDGTIHDKDNTFFWCNSSQADPGVCEKENNTESFINVLNSAMYGGYNDWRLPSVRELATLLNSAANEPAINTLFFPNTSSDICNGCAIFSNTYWSSTIRAERNYHVWIVSFEDGGSVYPSYKDYNSRVRAVRGGNPENPVHYVNNRNGTISDTYTGLMWQQSPSVEVNGISGEDFLGWEAALAYVTGLNRIAFGGYSDWRLPDRNELQTLVDYSRRYPAINTDFFQQVNDLFWSSSTDSAVNEKAWAITFDGGNTDKWLKTNGRNVRAVRTEREYRLLVGKTGKGTGTVTSYPGGISCGTDCTETYDLRTGTAVSLFATADSGSVFTGWSGACSGTGDCPASMTQPRAVSANFKDTSSAALVPTYLLLANPNK